MAISPLPVDDSSADVELLALSSRGDADAFELLYQRHNRALYNYLLRLIHRPTVAEELLQEVFLAAWKAAAKFRGEAKVKNWLFRIAHHRAVSWLRRNREEFTLDDEIPNEPVTSQAERSVEDSWRIEQLHIALDKLSPTHRAVLELAFFHEMNYAEIAKIMGCPIGTVKSRMSYARRNLSAHLKKLGVE
ncbi:MAG TPA: sigma-70 family RNA polymerase sigma factor [Thermoflexia bacterium]|nr:sigma-70 family RNA polymerase sigma factor [Thermoflexia bacterium]